MTTMPVPSPFGAVLRRCRLAAGLTQEALAERAGLSARAVSDLERGINRAPRADTLALLAGALGLGPEEHAALRAAAQPDAKRTGPPGPPHNLPTPLTSFIGRERDVAETARLMGTGRLVTLTGTGGTGKTRLALQVANTLLVPERFPGGVWLVEFAALTDPAAVSPAVATAVGVREEPGRPLLATLCDALRVKRLLLVLDNCEHLIGACAALVEALLRACPGVRILATGREPLGLAGETVWRVASLTLPAVPAVAGPPGPRRPDVVDQIARAEAVRLFVDRAGAALPGFSLTAQNATTIAQLCVRLDGIPLALELAAARVRVLPVEQLLSRLEVRFWELTGGSRTALPRQQTLQATVDWSYRLLTDQERVLFDRLAVFAGGVTLDAAETVCAGGDVEPPAVVDLLARLVEKSLVLFLTPAADGAAADPGGARYRLLETLRQYGWPRLVSRGEAETLRAAHAAYYLAFAEAAEPALRGAEQGRWLARLALDDDNLRAALRWSVEGGPTGTGRLQIGLRLAGALWRFWAVRGTWTEGRTLLGRLLDRARDQGSALLQTATHARALLGAGALAFYQGDYGAARACLEPSVALAREVDDPAGRAWALIYLGWVENDSGHSAAGRPYLEESLALSRALGDDLGVAWSLARLGLLAMFQGAWAAARRPFEESLALSRALGDRWGTAWCLHLLACLYVFSGRGDPAEALGVERESLAIWQETGNRRDLAYSLWALGGIALRQLDPAGAWGYFRQALPIQAAIGDKFGMLLTLACSATAAAMALDHERAECLAAATTAAARCTGVPVPDFAQALLNEHLARSRSSAHEAARAAVEARGRALSLEQAVAYALEGGETGARAMHSYHDSDTA